MLKVRLSRTGRNKLAFFRIVLTDHTKSAKSGYKEILGWFDPIKHKMEADITKVKEYIANGVQLSERVAKIFFAETKDNVFKNFIVERERKKAPKKEEKK